MNISYDLSGLKWQLSGWTPHLWRLEKSREIGASPQAEIQAIPVAVPGSVQQALRQAGILPDWNVGLNYRQCEWVENRHWILETSIPDGWIHPGRTFHLNCQGLDYCGWIFVNGRDAGEFRGAHVPHVFDLTPYLAERDNTLRIVFDLPPRWLGQFGYTSRMTDWKPRFNYTWDWVVRLVQTGVWDSLRLEETDGYGIKSFQGRVDADPKKSTGSLAISGKVSASTGGRVRLSLVRGDATLRREEVAASGFNVSGLSWSNLPVELWWPNLMGSQPLYHLTCELVDENGTVRDKTLRRIGFRHIEWRQCEGAPQEAYPNLCVVNGKPVFLQGVNWTPILPNFADVTEADYQKRLGLYRDLGLNLLRVWGGAFLEREAFYDLCDEMGLMVWQEFPLSSSGLENNPPEDKKSIDDLAKIAESYIARRQHHAALIIWCGGNELQRPVDGAERPVDGSHPLIKRLAQVVKKRDPDRRFLFTSPSGPVFSASPENFGKGRHWHVHGPWKVDGDLSDWNEYWRLDDAMLRSETGAPGTSSVELIRKYAGDLPVMPISADNPLWRRTSTWWIECDQFLKEHGRQPESLEEYVSWSQNRQAEALVTALQSCKSRFPRCGGFIVWMGHDCFPSTANTSLVDFEGKPKPAALALKNLWRTP
ncbi:MAG: glycoside hydrolase family 2 TIM barrel-domain containing protein [Opitutaceae bacterium]|nr:glycoside hydrolase family 2 TIM barrel-domain containing protein [Opitutaceae bacterium]